jgi:tRNA dimethylallyltransferase
MLEAGWLAEVRRLKKLPRQLSEEASQAIGYEALAAFLAGNGASWTDTVVGIQTATRQFAKRQLTWFRGLPGCIPCPAPSPNLADRVLGLWQEASRLRSG